MANTFWHAGKDIPMADSRSVAGSLPAVSLFTLFFFALMLPAGAQGALEPSTSISIAGIEQTERGLVVTGEVTYDGPVSGGGESHSYNVSVIADIKNSMVAEFPKLPEYLVIRRPPGAFTSIGPGSGPGNLMTIEERDGIDCIAIRTGPKPGTVEFELIIPREHAGKMVRIRAYLNYQYNNVGTPWPMIKYYHDIGYEGVLQPMGASASGSDETNADDTNGDNSDTAGDQAPETPEQRPYDMPDTVDVTVPKGEIDDSVEWGGDTEFGTVSGEQTEVTGPAKLPDEIELAMVMDDIKAQLSNPNLTSEQRNELAQAYNALVQAYGEMESNQIWLDYYSDTTFLASDLLLTYNPLVGPFWSAGKAGVDVAKGDYFGAIFNMTTTLGALKFTTAGKVYNTAQGTITILPKTYVLNKAGQKVQLAAHYFKILQAGVGPLPNSPSPPAADGGTYSNKKWIPKDHYPVKDLQ